jgi:glycosyltransferase involved in cell wall biosynthesis
MRVLIYAPAARMGGARAHVLGLVPELAAIDPSREVLLLAQPDLIAELPPLPKGWTIRAERAQARGFLGRLAWEQRVLARVAERWGADVLLSFGSFLPLRSPCPTVLEAGNALPFTSLYWQVLKREPWRTQIEERARWALLGASLRAATRILVPTRAMRQDVVTCMPELASKVDVALWGVAPAFHAARWPAHPSDDVILGVSKHGINKEFDVLIAALPQLRRRWHGVRLVLTGTANESRWSRRSMAIAQRLGVAEHLWFAGDVPNAGIPALIQSARLLVFPTWCESFGLPLAEALAMGAPAVAGDIPACNEVGEDAARYYAPGEVSSLTVAIDDVLRSPQATAAMANRAYERGRMFQWRDNALGVHRMLLEAAA